MTPDSRAFLWQAYNAETTSYENRSFTTIFSAGRALHVFINGQLIGSVYGNIDNPKVTFSRSVYLRAGVNKISIISITVGLPVCTSSKDRVSILVSSVLEFVNAIVFINRDLSEEGHLKFLHWFLTKHSRSKDTNIFLTLGRMVVYTLTLTGPFYYGVAPALTSRSLKRPCFENVVAPNTTYTTNCSGDNEGLCDSDNEGIRQYEDHEVKW
ncbi:hypothetical protein POM88_033882 [Heracleum sosnowskyi]|uniref:Beta-galactosidase n=1 Tax=Heracleum sosnowskyi TaxID=360622 RepID=A0AAD8HI79_9APIA|nr:hypothetical protein POM88_033882 [Heracleum sosnowskyi]